MEVSTDAISDREQKSLVKQCFEICSTLTDKGLKFSFSLKLGSSFNFSLSSEECSPKAKPRTRSRRPPAFYRRQNLRRAAFLEKKKKLTVPEEAVAENLLDKKVDSTVDNNTPLNLNPRAIYPRGSVESVEQEEDNCVNRDKNNVDNKSPQSKPPAANNQESSEDEEEDEESEEMEDSDKEDDRCGTDPWRRELVHDRPRQKERKADSVCAALQECSASGRLLDSLSHVTHCIEGRNCYCGVCLGCIHQRFLEWKKSSEKGPT